MNTTTYNVPNINCSHCVHTIKTELSEVQGVKTVEAWADKKQVTVTFEPPATDEKIREVLKEIDYAAA
jgi:copper chaperone